MAEIACNNKFSSYPKRNFLRLSSSQSRNRYFLINRESFIKSEIFFKLARVYVTRRSLVFCEGLSARLFLVRTFLKPLQVHFCLGSSSLHTSNSRLLTSVELPLESQHSVGHVLHSATAVVLIWSHHGRFSLAGAICIASSHN